MSNQERPVPPTVPVNPDVRTSEQPKAVDINTLRREREKESAADSLDGRKRY